MLSSLPLCKFHFLFSFGKFLQWDFMLTLPSGFELFYPSSLVSRSPNLSLSLSHTLCCCVSPGVSLSLSRTFTSLAWVSINHTRNYWISFFFFSLSLYTNFKSLSFSLLLHLCKTLEAVCSFLPFPQNLT